jgi:hypothetical protein
MISEQIGLCKANSPRQLDATITTTAKFTGTNTMIELTVDNQQAILTFPKDLLTADFVQDFLEKLKIEFMLEKSQLTETQAFNLAESIQANWWQQHKQTVFSFANSSFLVPKLQFGNAYCQASLGVSMNKTNSSLRF